MAKVERHLRSRLGYRSLQGHFKGVSGILNAHKYSSYLIGARPSQGLSIYQLEQASEPLDLVWWLRNCHQAHPLFRVEEAMRFKTNRKVPYHMSFIKFNSIEPVQATTPYRGETLQGCDVCIQVGLGSLGTAADPRAQTTCITSILFMQGLAATMQIL